MHDALRDNELDMVMCSIPAVPNRELWKVADTITRTWHAPVEYVALINEKTWQSLSAEPANPHLDVARKVEREVRDKLAEIEAEYYEFALGKGMKVYDLTPDQVADWRACSAEVIDEYMSDHPNWLASSWRVWQAAHRALLFHSAECGAFQPPVNRGAASLTSLNR